MRRWVKVRDSDESTGSGFTRWLDVDEIAGEALRGPQGIQGETGPKGDKGDTPDLNDLILDGGLID